MTVTAHVGDRIPDVPHLTPLLPLNTRVTTSQHGGGTAFTLVAPRTWAQNNEQPADPYYMNQKLFLHRLGGDLDELALPKESARRFRWRLRDTALGAADRSGVSIGPVLSLCSAIGATEALFEEGGIVTNNTDLQTLPEGAVFYQGHPDKPEWMNVWEVGPHGTHHRIMGRGGHREGGIRTIHTLPGWVVPEPEPPAEESVLHQIAARAWKEGARISRSSGWCGVYGQCLDSLMINEHDIKAVGALGYSVGDQVDRDSASKVPQGALLYWRWRNGNGFAVYQRDDSMTRVAARTRRVWGYGDDDENSHGHMIVAALPDAMDSISIPVMGTMLQHMPEGVRFHRQGYTNLRVTGDGSDIDTWGNYIVTGWPL